MSGRLAGAESPARKVLAIREADPRANGIVAFLALASDLPDVALEQLEGSLDRDPRDLELRSLAAAAYYLKDVTAGFRGKMVMGKDGMLFSLPANKDNIERRDLL